MSKITREALAAEIEADCDGELITLTGLQWGVVAVVTRTEPPRDKAGVEAVTEKLIKLGFPVDLQLVQEAIDGLIERDLLRRRPCDPASSSLN